MMTVTDDGIVLAHVTMVGEVSGCNADEDHKFMFYVRLCGSDRAVVYADTQDEAKAKRNEMIRLLKEFWKAQEDPQ